MAGHNAMARIQEEVIYIKEEAKLLPFFVAIMAGPFRLLQSDFLSNSSLHTKNI